MVDQTSERKREASTDDGAIGRRNVLRGTLVGVAGAGLGALPGAVSAHEDERKDEDRPNTITLEAVTSRVEYRIAVSGSIAFGNESGENDRIESDDTVVGLIEGRGGVDNYHFSGVITDFEIVAGDAVVLVNGEKVQDPIDLPERRNQIVLQAVTSRVEYRIGVSGSIAFGDESGENDRIEDGTVVGLIEGRGGVDNYHFSGSITDFEIVAGEAKIVVNGERVDDPVGLPQRLDRLVLQAVTERVEYSVTTSGSVAFGDEAGENDEIEDGTVTGLIEGRGGVDDYRFSGSSATVEFTEGTAVFVVTDGHGDGDTLPNTVTVSGQGPAVKYAFTVTGRVEKGEGVEEEETDIPADTVGESAVKGFVDAGDDGYNYSGAIKFLAEAPVAVTVELGADS